MYEGHTFIHDDAKESTIKAAKEWIKSIDLGKGDSIFFHDFSEGLRRWAKADAKKRGYHVGFAQPRTHFHVSIESERRAQQEEDWRRHEDWINSPG